MNLGSLLGDIVQPIATHVKEIIEPLDPIFDLLQARIPALSDISEVVGGPTITLLSMSKALSLLPNPPSQLINMIESADRLRVFSETVNTLAGLAGGGWINVGSFGISGPSGSSLLSTASAALGDLGIGNWSSLVSADGGINFEGFKQQIRNLLGSDLGDDVNGLWDALDGEFQGNGLTFDFPIAENPGGVALGMLLGQDADLVTVTGKLDQHLDRSFDIKIVPGFFIEVIAMADFDALRIGYDTRGLREAIAPLYAGTALMSAKH